ncbi:MAG TPA: ABC transporter permease [Acidimicrobiales bacterium]|nr:ABC transporter permease [Acidimicrobiales bacterium]
MSAARSPMVLAGAGMLLVLVAAAVLAPQLAPYRPEALAGGALQPPSGEHLLGTNHLGQDIFSQILWGGRDSLTVGAGAATVAVVAGTFVGVGAALLGGVADTVAMRVVDVFLGIPRLPLLVLVAAMVGPNRVSLIVLIAAMTWPVVARVLRSRTMSLRQRGFVSAARGFGGGLGYLMARHVVPALGPLVISSFILVAANAVLLEASLAFLGLGDPSGSSWGLMLNKALLQPGLYFTPAWLWWVLPAGFAITTAVLGLSFLGVGLEPLINRRWDANR